MVAGTLGRPSQSNMDLDATVTYFTMDPITKSHKPTQAYLDYLGQCSLAQYFSEQPPEALVDGCLLVPRPGGGPDYVVRSDGTVSNGSADDVAEILMPSGPIPSCQLPPDAA